MPALPSRHQQIIAAHAPFICQVATALQNTDQGPLLDSLLSQAEEAGWSQLAGAIRLIREGRRDVNLFAGLDEEDQVIVEAILRGLQDPSSLPDPTQKADPAMAAPGLAHMIHAAGRGNVEALTLVSQMAEQMSKAGGSMARLAALVRPMINGERDADKLCEGLDAATEQLVLSILDELGKVDLH